jgi:hypothetical protein
MTMHFLGATHRAIRVLTVVAGLTLVGQTGYAQQQPSAAALATAKEIVTVSGATGLFDPLIPGVIEQAKLLFLQQNPGLAKDLNEISAQLRKELTPRFSELVDEVAKNYAARFNEQELKDVLAFYKSPVGGKLLNEQGKIADASLKFAQTWSNVLSDQVIARMRDELKKKGHAM